MTLDIKKYKKNGFLAAVIILAVIFIVSLSLWILNFSGHRYTFLFPSVGSSQNVTETRRIPSWQGQEKIRSYVDELLLGPSINRASPLFGKDTRALFCFVRGRTLFVNLTDDALFSPSGVPFERSAELFRKNIFSNFGNIKSITLFIDGNSVDTDL